MRKKRQQPNRVFIRRTEAEWEIIKAKISVTCKDDLNLFLRKEIYKLANKKSGIGSVNYQYGKTTIDKYPSLTPHSYEVLKKLSIIMKRPMSSIVDQYIISPLLCDSSD